MHHPTLLACFVLAATTAAAQGASESPDRIAQIADQIVGRSIPLEGPGCTVGVSSGGTPVVRAYGRADLERGIPMSPGSIIEAGSVSKQFTAAAVTLLAIDGKLSFNDDIRRWFPELPDYGARITIRHLLTHTSGLRDWGAMAGMEGWPRGTRAHANEDALAIAARQKSLNYPPGSAYSYTNTGYNLLALLVQRASGKSLAQFSKERLFDPLGMRHTSWRDDYQRIVPGRALAYTGTRDAFTMDMPNEDAYGNGGLLTTAEDLLAWNTAMLDAKLGRALADSVVRQMVLTNGRTISYALGLFINPTARDGKTLEVQHSGSTAGYRAHLIRFPQTRLSVSVLCNGGAATNATAIANQIADSVLKPKRPPLFDLRTAALDGTPSPLLAYAGLWVNDARHTIARMTATETSLRRGTAALRRVASNEFRDAAGATILMTSTGGQPVRMTTISVDGDTAVFRHVDEWRPTDAERASLTGTYASAEVHGEPFVVAVDSGQMVLRQGPRTRVVMVPTYRDAFAAGSRMVWFTRGAGGRVTAMHLGEDRAWDVVFQRTR